MLARAPPTEPCGDGCARTPLCFLEFNKRVFLADHFQSRHEARSLGADSGSELRSELYPKYQPRVPSFAAGEWEETELINAIKLCF